MFADIEADIYVLVDGDDTYEAAVAPSMVRLLLEKGLDMVNGVRVSQESPHIGTVTVWKPYFDWVGAGDFRRPCL